MPSDNEEPGPAPAFCLTAQPTALLIFTVCSGSHAAGPGTLRQRVQGFPSQPGQVEDDRDATWESQRKKAIREATILQPLEEKSGSSSGKKVVLHSLDHLIPGLQAQMGQLVEHTVPHVVPLEWQEGHQNVQEMLFHDARAPEAICRVEPWEEAVVHRGQPGPHPPPQGRKCRKAAGLNPPSPAWVLGSGEAVCQPRAPKPGLESTGSVG